jgi:hypothetical protein
MIILQLWYWYQQGQQQYCLRPGFWPLSDYLRDTICLVAFLDTEVEAKLDQDSASVSWWRSPRGLRASSKQAFFMNDSSLAADTAPSKGHIPQIMQRPGLDMYCQSHVCLLLGTNTPMTRVE